MGYWIDKLLANRQEFYGNWYIARPLTPNFLLRAKDAYQVLIGKADAVYFAEQVLKHQINSGPNSRVDLCPNCNIPFNQHNITCPEDDREQVKY